MTRRPARSAPRVALASLLVGLTSVVGCTWDAPTVEHIRVRPVGAGSGVPARPYVPAAPVLAASEPVAIDIPAIGLQQPLVSLGLESDGTMEVPHDYDAVGWFRRGPHPGESGPAVIAGHVDSKRGPAAFYRLRELGAGDEVRVTRQDGSIVRFVVHAAQSFAKRSFPTERVFGPTAEPELRLVTCTGAFDRSRGSYVENLVVFAALA